MPFSFITCMITFSYSGNTHQAIPQPADIDFGNGIRRPGAAFSLQLLSIFIASVVVRKVIISMFFFSIIYQSPQSLDQYKENSVISATYHAQLSTFFIIQLIILNHNSLAISGILYYCRLQNATTNAVNYLVLSN